MKDWNQLPTRITDNDDTEGFKAASDDLLRGGLFVCFVALRPKSAAMVIAGLTAQFTYPHFFLGRLEQAVNQ